MAPRRQDYEGSGLTDLHQFVTRLRLAHVKITHLPAADATAAPRTGSPTRSSPRNSMTALIAYSERQGSGTGTVSINDHPMRQDPHGLVDNQGLTARLEPWVASPTAVGSPRTRLRPKEALKSSGHARLSDWEHEWRLETLPEKSGSGFSLLLDAHDHKASASRAPTSEYSLPMLSPPPSPSPADRCLRSSPCTEAIRLPWEFFSSLGRSFQQRNPSLPEACDFDRRHFGFAPSASCVVNPCTLFADRRSATEPRHFHGVQPLGPRESQGAAQRPRCLCFGWIHFSSRAWGAAGDACERSEAQREAIL